MCEIQARLDEKKKQGTVLEGKKSRLRDRVYWKWKRHEGRDGRRRRRIEFS